MKSTEKPIERRKHKRFQAQEGAYALLKDNSSKLGQIKNISKGGLAFSYIVNGGQVHESFNIDIFMMKLPVMGLGQYHNKIFVLKIKKMVKPIKTLIRS